MPRFLSELRSKEEPVLRLLLPLYPLLVPPKVRIFSMLYSWKDASLGDPDFCLSSLHEGIVLNEHKLEKLLCSVRGGVSVTIKLVT